MISFIEKMMKTDTFLMIRKTRQKPVGAHSPRFPPSPAAVRRAFWFPSLSIAAHRR